MHSITSVSGIYCGALIGAGVGFLWYSTYPAQVFMGDFGSLALGGGLGALAVVTKNELLSALQGGSFVIETMSVISHVFTVLPRVGGLHHRYERRAA